MKNQMLPSKMFCCGGEKESGRDLKSTQNTPSRPPLQMLYSQQQQQQQSQHRLPQPIGPNHMAATTRLPPPINQNHFNHSVPVHDRKLTGISEEVFRQIETVQNRYDSSTADAFRAVQKSGEMVVRTLDPRQFIRLASETVHKVSIDTNGPESSTSFVEIVKRPGQTLGLYIREGNGIDRSDGVFISRIAAESSIYTSGCLQIGDEIFAVNLVDVTRMSLDDVVIIMSIPRRLVLTTRRSRRGTRFGMVQHRMNGEGVMKGPSGPPVVVFKGGERMRGDGPPNPMYQGDGYDGELDSPARRAVDYNGPSMRDTRTLTWDRNPKPERNDPKYFPVNSLPRRIVNGRNDSDASSVSQGMPPPMRELNTGYQPRNGTMYHSDPQQARDRYSEAGFQSQRTGVDGTPPPPPGRGQRLLHRMAGERSRGGCTSSSVPGGGQLEQGTDKRSYTMQYSSNGGRYGRGGVGMHGSRLQSGLDYASDTDAGRSPDFPMRGHALQAGRTSLASRSNSLPRTFQREALLRHPELSMEMDRLASPSGIHGLLLGEDNFSDSGATSAPENVLSVRKRGFSSPTNSVPFAASGSGPNPTQAGAGFSHKELRRTPSTSAIYETLRRSKELRESLTSRPSSRLSVDMPRESEAQCFSDSEHQMVSGSMIASAHRQEMRRLRNRTLSGLESMRIGIADHHQPHVQRPVSASGSRPITPSFLNIKDPGHQFIDFNPADFVKYKSECDPESAGVRLSGNLHLHLLSGRGLRTGGRSQRRLRDLYCVVEVDHIHKARTVVRSGGVNFDWDEKFGLDLANNVEVEFLVYSWDPQLRHRLCYRSSLRLAALFGKGQIFQQVALRMHPTGTLYLTLKFSDMKEAYDRSRNSGRLPSLLVSGAATSSTTPPLPPRGLVPSGYRLFGASLERVLDQERTSYSVPLIVKRCIDEVEKRGLDIIGLYRLCGAETKKNMLRDAFDESPEMVDLSSENVPDINVITSLLKEYLRELPEPVFSNCLYQMLVDAMGVFLPDDPDGNAKLIFSILDCLPKANRNCLVHIMDHLSRVTSQASRNKMNSRNLAICFAPVLMLDFSSQSQPVATDISEPIQILKYLIEIWPKSQETLMRSSR